MRRVKKTRVVMRVKVKRRNRKKFWIAFAFLAAAAFSAHFSVRAWRYAEKLADKKIPSWKIGEVEITGLPDGSRSDIIKALNLEPGRKWLDSDSMLLGSKIDSEFQYLSSFAFKKKWISRKVNVQITLKSPVAKINMGGFSGYLDKSGGVFPAPEGFYGKDLVRVEIGLSYAKAAEERAVRHKFPGLAGFISDINLKRKFLSAEISAIEYLPEEEEFILRLADGSRVRWGEREFTSAKIERLNQILEDSKNRLACPVNADLRYFKDGKIIVNAIGLVTK